MILCAGSIGSIAGAAPLRHRAGGMAGAARHRDACSTGQGVGRNLQDHLQQRAIYKVEGVRTLNETYYSLLRRGLMGLDYAFRRRGPLTMAPSQLGIFTRSDPHRERANIQFHVQPLSLDKFGDPLHRFPAITVERLQSAADLARHRAHSLRASRTRRPRSRRTICRPAKTARSPPTPSAPRGG